MLGIAGQPINIVLKRDLAGSQIYHPSNLYVSNIL